MSQGMRLIYYSSFQFTIIRLEETRTGTRVFSWVNIMAQDFSKNFYSSKVWQDCRNEYMKCAHYLCEDCMKRGVYKPAEEVHHVEELTPYNIHRPEVALNFDNLKALCRDCHRARHHKKNKDRRYLVGDNGEVIINGEA